MITVQGSYYPNWRAGDEIVIAPSGWNPEEAELHTITAISGGNLLGEMFILVMTSNISHAL